MSGNHFNRAFVDNPAHLTKLGRALVNSGEGAKALALVGDALAAAPGDAMVAGAAAVVLTHHVPHFHRNMLGDAPRNDAYATAIARALDGGERVLDIGTGSGLLAMMAARAGASEIVAAESNSLLAATAREIVAANGFPAIRVIGKPSGEIDLSEIGGPVDVIVHEIFGDDLIGEGVLPALADAVSRLSQPDVKIVPARASVRVALAYYDQASSPALPTGAAADYDLRLFARHSPSELRIAVDSRHLQLRSEPRDLFAFDFGDRSTLGAGRASVAAASTGGVVNGIIQWLRIDFDQGPVYENRPADDAASHWKAVFHPVEEQQTRPGDAFAIDGWHDQYALRIWGAPAAA